MARNHDFVGVDEEFIPKEKTSYTNPVSGNEEDENKVKKGIQLIFSSPAFWIALVLIVVIVIGALRLSFVKQVIGAQEEIVDSMGEAFGVVEEKNDGIFGSIGNLLKWIFQSIINSEREMDQKMFNSGFEIHSGTRIGGSIGLLLDNVVTNNKTNPDHVITVTYKETTTVSEDEIVSIKHSFDDFTEYEVSLDYDANGYVNKVTITDILNNTDKESFDSAMQQQQEMFDSAFDSIMQQQQEMFNSGFEFYSGTNMGGSIEFLLDKVVTNNKTNPDRMITVTYKETATVSEDEIVSIKHSFDDFTEYEVSLDYDANGYVNKVTITDIP